MHILICEITGALHLLIKSSLHLPLRVTELEKFPPVDTSLHYVCPVIFKVAKYIAFNLLFARTKATGLVTDHFQNWPR